LLVLGFISYQRYENLQAKHVCIFNNNQLVVTVKNKSKIICFYDTPIEKLDKIKFTVSNYLKNYPGEVEYVSIYKKNTQLAMDNELVKISKSKEGRLLEVKDSKYMIHYSNKSLIKSKDFAMPWVVCKNSLSTGARIIGFN
jgi:hypothetical protein